MIYEIPIANDEVVYMQGTSCNVNTVVIVSADKFWELWDAQERVDSARESKENSDADKCFKQSKQYPVPLAEAGDLFDYEPPKLSLKMVSGITRLQWLYHKKATWFPVLSSHSGAELLKQLAGHTL